jgi:hypothetical protein
MGGVGRIPAAQNRLPAVIEDFSESLNKQWGSSLKAHILLHFEGIKEV